MPKMNEFTAYHNGEWKPWSDVKIDPLDLGFVLEDAKEQSYSDGVHYTPMTNSKIAKAIKKYIIE